MAQEVWFSVSNSSTQNTIDLVIRPDANTGDISDAEARDLAERLLESDIVTNSATLGSEGTNSILAIQVRQINREVPVTP